MRRAGKTLEQRFWDKVDKVGQCLVWTGNTSKGYGQLCVNGKMMPAHRLAYLWFRGEIPDGLWVLHSCDNPPCIRPDHLFLGTNADNVRDSASKGRHGSQQNPTLRQGERNGGHKVTAADVVEIRRAYAMGGVTQKDLARRYGLAQSKISAIVLRQTWAHVA